MGECAPVWCSTRGSWTEKVLEFLNIDSPTNCVDNNLRMQLQPKKRVETERGNREPQSPSHNKPEHTTLRFLFIFAAFYDFEKTSKIKKIKNGEWEWKKVLFVLGSASGRLSRNRTKTPLFKSLCTVPYTDFRCVISPREQTKCKTLTRNSHFFEYS